MGLSLMLSPHHSVPYLHHFQAVGIGCIKVATVVVPTSPSAVVASLVKKPPPLFSKANIRPHWVTGRVEWCVALMMAFHDLNENRDAL